jgi:hypothetical protein
MACLGGRGEEEKGKEEIRKRLLLRTLQYPLVQSTYHTQVPYFGLSFSEP